MTEHYVQTTEKHEFYGNPDVSTAHQFLGKLPNGWDLVSLEWKEIDRVGLWIAIVREKREKVKDTDKYDPYRSTQ